jgi:hypothetical protein
MLRIVKTDTEKKTITLANKRGRIMCVKRESKFLRHLLEIKESGVEEIPAVCFKDFHSLDNIDILDIDDFYVYDMDKEIIDDGEFSAMKYSLADMKFVNVRRK